MHAKHGLHKFYNFIAFLICIMFTETNQYLLIWLCYKYVYIWEIIFHFYFAVLREYTQLTRGNYKVDSSTSIMQSIWEIILPIRNICQCRISWKEFTTYKGSERVEAVRWKRIGCGLTQLNFLFSAHHSYTP